MGLVTCQSNGWEIILEAATKNIATKYIIIVKITCFIMGISLETIFEYEVTYLYTLQYKIRDL